MTMPPLMIDVSSNNAVPTSIPYPVIAVKATQGLKYVNPDLAAVVAVARRCGRPVVFYHFGTTEGTGALQADHFLAVIRPHLRRGDGYAYDGEDQPAAPGYSPWQPGQAKAVHDRFIDRVRATGPRFGILRRGLQGYSYVGKYFAEAHGIVEHYWRLWLPAYGVNSPAPPRGFRPWVGWQFTDRASVPGEAGLVDCSHIRGPLLPGILPRPVIRYPVLRLGARGPWVVKLQDLLVKHGAKIKVDGVFGHATESAVNRVKHRNGWRVDGAVGPRVWKWLLR